MPSLDRRRVQAAGQSLSVTLPAGWCRYMRLKAGDEVEIIANDDLVIHCPSAAELSAAEQVDGRRSPI